MKPKFKKRYVLGVGMPLSICIRKTRVGVLLLENSGLVELEDFTTAILGGKYRLVLERVK